MTMYIFDNLKSNSRGFFLSPIILVYNMKNVYGDYVDKIEPQPLSYHAKNGD